MAICPHTMALMKFLLEEWRKASVTEEFLFSLSSSQMCTWDTCMKDMPQSWKCHNQSRTFYGDQHWDKPGFTILTRPILTHEMDIKSGLMLIQQIQTSIKCLGCIVRSRWRPRGGERMLSFSMAMSRKTHSLTTINNMQLCR